MTKLERFERAAAQDLKVALVREALPLAIIVTVAVVLQRLTRQALQGKP